MASQLEMSLSGYGKLERGEVELTVSKLFKLSEILNVNISQILNFDAAKVFDSSYRDAAVAPTNHMNYSTHADQYIDKYIALLEREIERLQKEG